MLYLELFADYNNLPAWEKSFFRFIDTLEFERVIAIDCFTKNEMIINPDKFQSIIFDKKKCILKNILLTFDNQNIESSVGLFRIHLKKRKTSICVL